jgi:Transcriptional regulators
MKRGDLRQNLVSPSAQHVAQVLERKILSGEYQSGQWLPSERVLAEEFGVSRVIIRAAVQAVEERNLITRAARCRPVVRGVSAASGGDAPTSAPIAAARRNVALLIWPAASWPGSASIVQGIRQTLSLDDFRLVLETAVGDTDREISASEARFLQRLHQDQDIEGLILWYLGGEAPANREALETVRSARIPMVFIDRRPPSGFDADYVGVDNVRAAEQVTRHLIAAGHRRVAHVTNLDNASTVYERRQGYERALRRAGIEPRPEWIRADTGSSAEDHASGCARFVDEWLAQPEPPTAVFAVNDIVAFHLIAVLRERGVRVPEDIAVAGFDGMERWGHAAPFLTSAYQPFEQIGAHAAELLLERIEQGAEAPYRHVLLDAPLTVRASTGAVQQPPARRP